MSILSEQIDLQVTIIDVLESCGFTKSIDKNTNYRWFDGEMTVMTKTVGVWGRQDTVAVIKYSQDIRCRARYNIDICRPNGMKLWSTYLTPSDDENTLDHFYNWMKMVLKNEADEDKVIDFNTALAFKNIKAK